MGAEGDTSDFDLIERMRAGDVTAFHALYDRHVGLLAARARRLLPRGVRRRISVEDVIQEARVAAFRGAHGFRGVAPEVLRAWLVRIVEFKARQAVRHDAGAAKRACGREVSRDERVSTGDLAAEGPTPSQAAASAELRAEVARVLDSLPPAYREVLQWTRLRGMTLGEAAQRMGRSHEAVKKLYGRAMARFAEALGAGREEAL